jgi:hypothetical protein
MKTSKGHIFVVILSCALGVIGLAAGFVQALLYMRRDGHPAALIFWCVIVGLGLWVLVPMIRYFFRIINGKG